MMVPCGLSLCGTPVATISLSSARPVSMPTGFAPDLHNLRPLYFAGLWLAVIIAPGMSRKPLA